MPLARVVEIMRQVTGALAAAHAEGVIHRDLKSDNIMLMDVDNGQDWAKVLDFGIAKIQEPVGQDPALTAPNLIIGTPQYMSPEQCSQSSELDARSDIYSLGVILYEMLAGHVPFTGDSPTAIMMRHLQEPPPSLVEERKDLPAAVSHVVTRAMAKRPEDRYQTVGELAEALTLAAGNNQTTATTGVAAANSAPDHGTARIVVPTATNRPALETSNTEHDEATIVVPPQTGRSAVIQTESINARPIPPPADFNLGRFVILSAIGLVVVVAVIYAVSSRNAKPSANDQNAQPLTSDPNNQPVKPAQPPTGQSEKGIAATAPAVPTNANTNSNTGLSAPPVETSDSNAVVGSSPIGNTKRRNNANNGNGEQQGNDNATGETQTDSNASDANANGARRQQPKPQPTLVDSNTNAEPTPVPSQKKRQSLPLPKPAVPTDAPPPPPADNTPAR